MNKTALTIAAAFSLSLCAGTLSADEHGKKEGVENGVSPDITTQGMKRGEGREQAWDAETVMEDYDMNNDGELDEEELGIFGAAAAGTPHGVRAGEDHGQELMDRLDQDGDGAVTREELEKSDLLDGGMQGSGGMGGGMERGQGGGISQDPAPEETGTAK